MAVTSVTDDTFAAELAAPLVVVDFFAAWCGPCIMFRPKFKRISNDYPHVKFVEVDGEAAPGARKTVTIDNLPYFGFYKDGVLVEGRSMSDEAAFRETLEKHFGKAP